MNAGLPHAGVVQIIVSSNEYFLRAGSDAIFVTSLFRDLLGREGSQLDTGFWRAQLAAGRRRDVIVGAFLSSTEYRAAAINADYQRLLGRSVDAPALAFWLGQVQFGRSLDDVAVTLLASDEHFARQ